MNSYSDHNYYLRKKWLNERKTKHHPRNCDQHHSFCNLDYQWLQQNPTSNLQSSLINQSIPNISLPKHQQHLITINYNAITEQDLDDWIGQSINRNITSIINPQKQFFIPVELEQDMKHRYRNKSVITKGQEDVYFTNSLMLKGNTKKKKRPQLNQLIFNYHNLQVKHIPGGTPIRFRQNKNKKPQIKRRHAVLLQQDIHYSRLMREMTNINSSRKQNQHLQLRKQPLHSLLTNSTTTTNEQRMFYSYNIQSLNRTQYYQQTPTSITQKQFIRLKQPTSDALGRKHQANIKQQVIHEKFRTTVVDNTKNAQRKITQINNNYEYSKASLLQSKQHEQKSTTTQLQRTTFKLRSVRKPIIQNLSTSTIIEPKLIAKDRALQKKITLLLNDMQIISEQIDVEMSQLNIHLTEVELTSTDSRPQTKWVLKAEEKLHAGQIQLAIDCYKQALIIQPEFFVPIFNIASLLEKQKQYSQARRWFEICKQFGIDEEMVKFGLGIVFLKQMKFPDCYNVIDEIIKKNQTQKKIIKMVYYYIRALCAKKLGKYEQARNDYSIILKNCKPSYFGMLNSLMVSTLLSKSRRLALKFDALSYLKFRQILYIVYFTPEQKLKSDNEPLKSIAKKLSNADFFKRFSISLVEKLLQNSTYEYSKPDTLIFVNDDETVILLSGMIIVRNHLHQFNKPQTVSVLQQGGVIGSGKIDHFINEKSNNWFITKSQVELIKVQRKSFNEFWKGQITFEMDFKYNFIKNVGLFKNLSQWALFNICERVQKVKYSYGTILYNDCSYRNELINRTGSGFSMGKTSNNVDPRFINVKKVQVQKRKKTKYRIAQLLKKHYVTFSAMKFNKLKYPGLYIVINGKIQIEDDRGFRCSDLISEREYFGENLIIDSDGFHRYGRMIVVSQHAELYIIPVDRLGWMFNEQDKQTMRINTKGRQSVDTVHFLRSRFIECQNTRINYKFLANLNNR